MKWFNLVSLLMSNYFLFMVLDGSTTQLVAHCTASIQGVGSNSIISWIYGMLHLIRSFLLGVVISPPFFKNYIGYLLRQDFINNCGHPVWYNCRYFCLGSSYMAMVILHLALQNTLYGTGCWQILELCHLLKVFNLFWKLTLSKLFSTINNDYRSNHLLCFYIHIIWSITIQHIWMAPANMDAWLNIHYYMFYVCPVPRHNKSISQFCLFLQLCAYILHYSWGLLGKFSQEICCCLLAISLMKLHSCFSWQDL